MDITKTVTVKLNPTEVKEAIAEYASRFSAGDYSFEAECVILTEREGVVEAVAKSN